MGKTMHLYRGLYLFGIPFSLLIFIVFMIRSSLFEWSDTMSLAISADLLLTVPILYFLLIRKSSIPNTTVIPVLVLCLFVGFQTIPQENQQYLHLFKSYFLPVIELGVVTYILYRIRQLTKTFKQNNTKADFYTKLKMVCEDQLPKIAIPLVVTELSVVYYGFINWKKREQAENEFSYHKKSGTPAIGGAFIFIIAVEIFAVHILVMQWNEIVAWVLAILSLYSILQVWGFMRALSKRPYRLEEEYLQLDYGIMSEMRVKFVEIEQVEISRKRLQEDDEFAHKLSPMGDFESHNMILRFKNEQRLKGIYGMKKSCRTLGLFVDNPEAFKKAIEEKVGEGK